MEEGDITDVLERPSHEYTARLIASVPAGLRKSLEGIGQRDMNVELLRELSNAPGLSGFEESVQEIAAASLRQTCDEVRRDRLGNVIGLKKATAGVQ